MVLSPVVILSKSLKVLRSPDPTYEKNSIKFIEKLCIKCLTQNWRPSKTRKVREA